MALKYFTNSWKGNATDSIAINPKHVVSVYEKVAINPDTNEMKDVTAICGLGNLEWHVEETYLEVVSRLNERD